MGFEDVDLKEIMKQVGRELGGAFGEAFGADENTFLPNDGKTTMPDWKAMMGKGKMSVPDWSALAKESFSKKKKGRKNKKSEDEILAKCAEYAEAVAERAVTSEDEQGDIGSGADAQEDVKKSRRLPGGVLKEAGAGKTSGGPVGQMKIQGGQRLDPASKQRMPAFHGGGCKMDMEGVRAAVRTSDAARMQEAIVWSEILGEPVSVRCRRQRKNYRHENKSNAD